ncbi:MAG: LpqB family beta-propeller domain-containing protein [Proteobacteria bacterium]|nr:LpqB family beta-propeller domain-containing protein [Pseudomonadota bacterium]
MTAEVRSLIRRGSCLALLALPSVACVPLPMHLLPPVAGQVLDEKTGKPLQDAVVVVRFDARHGELLPDRDLLRHREAVTDGSGRFRIARAATPGLTAWPMIRTEARVVGVMKPGYRCGAPERVGGRFLTLRLTPSRDEAERRASCRPVAARPSEAPEYLAAWRALYPRDGRKGRMADERPLKRLLEARRIFGVGENCTGPVVDLALAPGGARLAIGIEQAGRRSIEVVALESDSRRVARLAAPAEADGTRARRLAWASGGELILWEPGDALDRALAPSSLGAAGSGSEVVWRGATPPAHRAPSNAGERILPVLASELNDEGDARWLGRSFQVVRSLDPLTGLASSELHTQTSAGEEFVIPLPGESCGPAGQYGRPHYRITADGEVGVDLRYVDGGCHALAIHLTNGKWKRLDDARAAGVCAQTRRVPLPQLRAAMRGYVRDLEETLAAAGGDPGSAYQLRIAPDGRTTLIARDYLGASLKLVVAPFPVETPLSRIDVTAVGYAGEGPALEPPAAPAPALEPL